MKSIRNLAIFLGLLLIIVLLAEEGRRGLVIRRIEPPQTFEESFRGAKIIVTTHPSQPMELNPYRHPRMSVHMEWSEMNRRDVTVILTFIWMGKKQSLSPVVKLYENLEWVNLGEVEFDARQVKSGRFETVRVNIGIEGLRRLIAPGEPPRLTVGHIEFIVHEYEWMDLREAWVIWGGRG